MFSQYYLRLARNYRLKDHLPPIGSRVSIARAGLVSPLSLSLTPFCFRHKPRRPWLSP